MVPSDVCWETQQVEDFPPQWTFSIAWCRTCYRFGSSDGLQRQPKHCPREVSHGSFVSGGLCQRISPCRGLPLLSVCPRKARRLLLREGTTRWHPGHLLLVAPCFLCSCCHGLDEFWAAEDISRGSSLMTGVLYLNINLDFFGNPEPAHLAGDGAGAGEQKDLLGFGGNRE